jgi:serine/threonine protein phosphatase 1
MLEERVPRIPDDWTVWAFSDPHGVTSGLLAGLIEAGLVDRQARWSAPPRTALVGCGDYIDRGADVRGTVDLLRIIEAEASAAGGIARFVRGNHEQMAVHVHAGRLEWTDTWFRYGGRTSLASYGVGPLDVRDPARTRAAVDAMEHASPGLFGWLGGLAHAVRWRDVLLVHGGLPIDHGLEDLGTTTDEHLWIRASFYETPWESGAFDRYRRAGVQRVVFGHTPQADGPTVYHDGRSLCLDTNAVGNTDMPSGSRQLITLAALPPDGPLDGARFVVVPTHDAPDRARQDA